MRGWLLKILNRRPTDYFASPHGGAVLCVLLALGLLLPSWWLVGEWCRARMLDDQRGGVVGELTPLGNALSAAISRRFGLLDGLSAFVRSEIASPGGISREKFEAFADGLHSRATGIRIFVVAPHGITRYVYPRAGNENLLGQDLLRDQRSNVRMDIERAIQSHRIVLSAPYELADGGLGLVARRVIYNDGGFWGMVAMVLDLPPILSETGLQTPPGGLTLAIRDDAGHIFHGETGVFQAGPVVHRIDLPEGSWTLAGLPHGGWEAAVSRAVLLFRGVGLAFVGMLAGVLYQMINRQVRLAAAVKERTEELERDIVKRQCAEEALRMSRARLAGIVEITEDAIISIDESHQITLFNQGAEKTFGYRGEEVLGKPLDILIPRRFIETHIQHVRHFTASADALRPMNDRGPVFGLRKDGTEFPAEASISKFEVGGEKVLTVRLRDVSERMRAEEALSRLAAVVESSDDAIYSKTLDGIVLTWNTGAEHLFGYSAEEITGRPISLVIPFERRREDSLIFDRIRHGECVQHYETVRLRKDGRRIDVSVTVSPIRSADGKVVAASSIVRDITERKRLEMQMRQAQKMEAIGTLAGGIAHDFNNLLSAIVGYAELVTDEVPKDAPAWHNLQEVLAAGKRAKELVRQILTFSRQGEQEYKPVALHQIVGEAVRFLRASLPATIEIRQFIDSECGTVRADPIQMHQVLMNLCTNAEHSMRDKGGLLEVRLEGVESDPELAVKHRGLSIGSYVRITVRDTGSGMTPGVRERIFDPFFTTKGPGEGTGLGLAVVHGIVSNHGGVITVDSAPGLGTRFEVLLPRFDPPETGVAPVEEPPHAGSERILFVDDEPFLTHLWETVLERLGYQVLGCGSGSEALEIFHAAPESYDLVITDQTMPRITGEELAKELLRIRPDLPIILCTGFSHAMTEEKARAMGIGAYLTKPFSRRELAHAVRRVLEERTATAH